MSEMPRLMNSEWPRARHTDPPTSHAAAASVTNMTDKQAAVKAALAMLTSILSRPVLDEELVDHYVHSYKQMHWPQQSESGIRSRRAELKTKDQVVECEKMRMSTGRLGRTWRVA